MPLRLQHHLRPITSLLLLIFHQHHIILRYALQHAYLLNDHIQNLIGHVPLHDDLVEALRVLGNRGTSGELLGKQFGGFLEVDTCKRRGTGERGCGREDDGMEVCKREI
jgi:hypothetical protein